MAKDDSQELLSIVEPVVREKITSDEIVDVVLRRGFDHDGDPKIFIDVVFDNPQERLDPNETVSLSRFVRHELLDRDIEEYPHLSFTAASEWSDSAAA